MERLTKWIGDRSRFYLVPGERWSDAVNSDVAGLKEADRANWAALLRHLLTATTAVTRRQALERLIPRLKIADRCSLADRFPAVRDTKRTY